MKRTAVLNVVGLTSSVLGESTPRINRYLASGAKSVIQPAFPAVTCTAQSTYLTGTTPSQHGIVANGWYNRELAEVQFWKQSNHIVHGRKIWDELRELIPGTTGGQPNFTCAKLFWWYNMYSTADYSITPRPMYPADGRKVFDIYTLPFSIRTEIKLTLGEFPFATFWGPGAGVDSPQGKRDAASRWIAESAKWIEQKYAPTLSLVYLPHLDYNFQRLGPLHPDTKRDLREIDAIVGNLIDFYSKQSVQVVLLSEYGISQVYLPIDINVLFRKKGWLVVKEELGREMLDCGASEVFAVADHQIAHVYVKDPSMIKQVRRVLEAAIDIEKILDRTDQAILGIDHSRAGDLVLVARDGAWFTYYYWYQDRLAPDFARCVDIHRKPGYDPAELFLDPKIKHVKPRILFRLFQKKLGFRMLMDVIPLDATLVKGSHGRMPANSADWPIVISPRAELLNTPRIEAPDVYHVIKRHVLH